MPRYPTNEALHEQIDGMLSSGLTVADIGREVEMAHSSVSHHVNNHCKCKSPRYVYVPESWFVCRKCSGGWHTKNGCDHAWGLVI